MTKKYKRVATLLTCIVIVVIILATAIIILFEKNNSSKDTELDSNIAETAIPIQSTPSDEELAESDLSNSDVSTEEAITIPSREEIIAKYAGAEPATWGEFMDGIISVLPSDEKVVAITLDACGWGEGSDYDEALMEFLISEEVPATLFISGKWIEDNPGRIEYLSGFDFFEIENHGYLHKPLSIDGRSQYGIKGTASVADVYDEIENNAKRIYDLTGRRPMFFRTGTAFYDDVSIKIAADLGQKIAGYTLAGDGGATYSKKQIQNVCKNPENGSIMLFHMNHPKSGTSDGIKAVYKDLKGKGYSFVRMDEYYTSD